MRRLLSGIFAAVIAITCTVLTARSTAAQRPVTIEEAVAAASSVPRMRVVRADSAAAAARLLTASAFPNPALSLGYSKSPPPYHVEVEQPIPFPWLRRSRVDAARLSAQAAALGIDIERARLRYDGEASYANGSIARSISVLSTQNARDADELVRIAIARRDAGDAAELDVDLARVFAAGMHRTASIDSLNATIAVLELQAAMGLSPAAVEISPSDTFAPALPTAPVQSGLALQQAELEEQAAAKSLDNALRSRTFSEVAIRAGFETGDPDMKGMLPTLGISIPLPIFDRNRGPIAEARADHARSTAQLEQLRLERTLGLAVAEKQRNAQQVILAQDRAGLENARRVAARAQTAYREGEYPLSTVLEAQRNARDAMRQYYEDMGSLWLAQAAFTLARIGGVRP
jgi:cobalt-zinc-cadmium efflux system outer membrane protein